MYGYEPTIDISPAQVLQKIDQKDIFELVFNHEINYEELYVSPLREDSHPGCRFTYREDGTWLFVDFGEKTRTGRTHRTCFGMLMEIYDVNLSNALKIICTEFRLPMDTSGYEPVKPSQEFTVNLQDDPTEMSYNAKTAGRLDIGFWSQFLIRPEHLTEDRTFCVSQFRLRNKKRGLRVITPYKYCYVFDFYDKMKFYQPFNEKYKWITNCDEDNIGNIDNLPPTGDELVIQKSYKDHRVVRNVVPDSNVIWFQNEGCIPSLEILKNLTERFKLITIFYDNDEAGILAAMRLSEVFNQLRPNCARMIHLPVFVSRRLEYKDPGAFVQHEGRQDLIIAFKQIGLWKSQ